MTIDDVARITKIQPRILERLESGRLDGLPAEVFVRGFVRSFARCVGLAEDEAVRRFTACTAAPETARAVVEVMAELAPSTARVIKTPPVVVQEAPPLASGSMAALPIPAAEIAPEAAAAAAPNPRHRKKRRGKRNKRKATAVGTPPHPSPVVTAPEIASAGEEIPAATASEIAPIDRAAIRDAAIRDAAIGDAAIGDAATGGAANRGAAIRDAATGDAATGSAAIDRAAIGDTAIAGRAIGDAANRGAAIGDAATGDAATGDAATRDAAIRDAANRDAAMGDATTDSAAIDAAADADLATTEFARIEPLIEPEHVDEPIATEVWQPKMPAPAPWAPWRRSGYAAATPPPAPPSLVIDDADPESAERVLEARTPKEPRRSFLPPILLDREDRSARQGGLTLAVILLLIAATLTLSYLMRRPNAAGDGMTRRDVPASYA